MLRIYLSVGIPNSRNRTKPINFFTIYGLCFLGSMSNSKKPNISIRLPACRPAKAGRLYLRICVLRCACTHMLGAAFMQATLSGETFLFLCLHRDLVFILEEIEVDGAWRCAPRHRIQVCTFYWKLF